MIRCLQFALEEWDIVGGAKGRNTMGDCAKCRYGAEDHVAGSFVCMYMGDGCLFEEKEDAPQESAEAGEQQATTALQNSEMSMGEDVYIS